MSDLPKARTRRTAGLDGQQFDVVVIGGGINGVAVARECARAGRRTLIVEQHDFASGTTSRSTRIIHGGLRYLEHGEIGLVRESLRERERLLRERPHLVRPLNFLLAFHPSLRRNALTIRAGLWLYQQMGAGAPAARNSFLREFERSLDSGRKWTVFQYDDAQCEYPERLVAEWLAEAIACGAVAMNHCEVLQIHIAEGRAERLTVRDKLSGSEAVVQAKSIVNAAGPWGDRVCAGLNIRRMIGGVRGSHILVSGFTGAPTKEAVYMEAQDGRMLFVIPWAGRYMVGTTEIADDDDPTYCEPSNREVRYLLSAVNRLFPAAHLGPEHVIAAFAGVRPLIFDPGSSLSARSRRHEVRDHTSESAAGLLSIIGGKLTTATAIARDVVRAIGIQSSASGVVFGLACKERIDHQLAYWTRSVASAHGISEPTALALAEWHGRRALAIAKAARSDERLRQPLCPHTHHVVAEALEAVNCEAAVRLADVLLRRVPVALGSCWSDECGHTAATRIGTVLGWSQNEVQQELEYFEEERGRFLHRPRAGVEGVAVG